MVPPAGVEPALLAELDFESSASTNSATGALGARPNGGRDGPQQPAPPPPDSGENLVESLPFRVRPVIVRSARSFQEHEDEKDEREDQSRDSADQGEDSAKAGIVGRGRRHHRSDQQYHIAGERSENPPAAPV